MIIKFRQILVSNMYHMELMSGKFIKLIDALQV